jgi:ankyrin repeat protein
MAAMVVLCAVVPLAPAQTVDGRAAAVAAAEQLGRAIEAEDAAAVREIVARDPEVVDRIGSAMILPLAQAAVHESDGMVALLIELGADVDASDGFGNSALVYASALGSVSSARRLLDAGASVEHGGLLGIRPMHWAVFRGDLEMIRLLHDRGADIGGRDDRGSSPLHFAAACGRRAVAALLLDLGADPAVRNDRGLTPLHGVAAVEQIAELKAALDAHAARAGTSVAERLRAMLDLGDEHAAIAALLLDHGADIDSRGREGWTPLASAATHSATAVAELLLQRGADWRLRDQLGFAPLHTAAEYGNARLVGLLLERGADPGQPVTDSRTPLHLAAQTGSVEVLALLLEQGVPIDARERNGATPLQFASIAGAVDAAALLLERGADVDAADRNGHTALMGPVMGMLLREGADRSDERMRMTNMADADSAAALTDLLLEHEADPTEVDARAGRTALHWAALAGATRAARMLVDEGASVDRRDRGDLTPLHLAASAGRTETALTLIELGAAVDAVGGRGALTPLHLAAGRGAHELVRQLIAQGADPKRPDGRGAPPIGLALAGGHENAAMVLAAAGAEIGPVTVAQLDPRTRAHVLAGRGVWLARAGRPEQATRALEEALPLLECELGRGHETTVFTIESLVTLSTASGDLRRTGQWSERLLRARAFDPTVIAAGYDDGEAPANMARDAIAADDPEARRNGILALSEQPWGGGKVYVKLYRSSLDDRHHDVRVAAIRALARHGDAEDLPALGGLARHPDASIRTAAAQAMNEIGKRAGYPILRQAVKDGG